MITTHPTKNCNVIYFEGLESYGGRPQAALLSLFTNKLPRYYYPTDQTRVDGPPVFSQYKCGYLLFALGSEHAGKKYAHNLADYIAAQKLGEVFEHPPAANQLHANKPGILFTWLPNWPALEKWWNAMPEEDRIRASKGQL